MPADDPPSDCCAGCGGPLRPDMRYPSLSRTDNKTMVCCICGEMEALMAAGLDHTTARAITDASEWIRLELLRSRGGL